MKQAYYFAHDSNARNDVKIIRLRRTLGLEAYGAYWCIIETLRDAKNYTLPIAAIDDIAYSLNSSVDLIRTVIYDYELFEVNETDFYSTRLQRNMGMIEKDKSIKSESGKKGMQTRWSKSKKMIL